VYKTLTEESNQTYFDLLVDGVEKNLSVFSTDEIKDLYLYVQNYCIRKIQNDQPEFLTQLFLIYKRKLAHPILSKKLRETEYRNIVSVGLRLKEYEWVHDFIYEFKKRIPPAIRKNTFNYNLANYYYSIKDYSQALMLLQEVAFTDIFYRLGSRCLLLKIYYESDEMEALDSLIKSFKIYLIRNHYLSSYQQTIYTNLIRFVHSIVRLKKQALQYDVEKKEATKQVLLERLHNTKDVASLEWLKECLMKI